MVKKQSVLSDSEAKRLDALSSYNVLDTLPEKEYDAITRLASYICQVPIALISLVDSDRQWIKSKVGIDISETTREEAFCNYTILHDELHEVPDASIDSLLKDNPYVSGEAHIRFYAGAPLVDPDGNRLGALCVVDTIPHKLTEEQREALQTLAREIMSRLVLRKKTTELEGSLQLHKEFFNLFDTSPEIHFMAGRDGSIELINKAVTNVLGYEPEQAIGKSLWSFVAGNDRGQYAAIIEKAKTKGQSFEIETRTIGLNGQEKWIDWCGAYKSGKWYASGRDITYQKQLSAEKDQLALVASKMINGVAVSNADDKVVWINNAFETITGYDFADVKGKRLRDVFVPDRNNIDSVRDYNANIQSKKSYSVHVYATRKDGEQIWLSVITTVIYDENGDVEKYIRVIADITSRKTAQKDLEILSFASRKSPSGMLTRDATGIVVWMNEAMERITGYTLAEMKGKRFGTILLGEDTDMDVYHNAVKAVQEKRSYEAEILIYRKDRTPVWVSMSNSPLFNDAGEVDRQVTNMVDVTERKRVETELKMLSLVASNTTSGVVINNSEGEIEWVNNAFEKITGYNNDDVRAKHLGDLLQGELTDTAIIEKGRELSRMKKSFEVDLLGYKKDGTPIWVTVINSVILNRAGDVDKYIEVVIDISARKKVEMELVQAKEEAVLLSRAKDMFISVMSHEIRTPLNAVIGMSRLLLDDNPLESQKENLDILKFSADNLLKLINEVLDFTKIETGNVELEKDDVNLRNLVQGIAGSLQYRTKEKGIYLKAEVDPAVPETVIGDSTRLSQILLNIINNAVKFTDEGGVKIELSVVDETKKTARIRFSIIDTGIGIPADKINTIFESFKQAEASTTRKYGGTGLGLAISKRLIELHDSRVNVDSEVGKGSTFWFTVTFNKTNAKKNTVITVGETGLNMNVLVVDDNQINRLLVNKILTKWGAGIDFAENGLQAVDKVEHNEYDVVLMDMHMPVMGGLEATRVIRSKAEPYFKQLPIIALTASMLSNELGEITVAGMNDFILKPFEPQHLFEKLSRYQKQ
ncbi:PAS domain S-box protein [Mucilaginibacter corticis]|uniref:histidine kinase n=1 Tax=Mucilaginibacter corticis TaxID=2597670 RepID=A0A556MSA3_9SPHI|nr:PAS domain-containing protein [Mucilaginibacter corticis]TSJ42841.1 PAS domain S-box protein [Mucilaginibacter corticis]